METSERFINPVLENICCIISFASASIYSASEHAEDLILSTKPNREQ